MKKPAVRARSESLLDMVPGQCPIQTNCNKEQTYNERYPETYTENEQRYGCFVSSTCAPVCCSSHQGQVDKIVGGEFERWESVVPGIENQNEDEDDDGECKDSDYPVLPGPLPPPNQRTKTIIRHIQSLENVASFTLIFRLQHNSYFNIIILLLAWRTDKSTSLGCLHGQSARF